MNESIVKTIGVAFAVCLICSLVVSSSAVSLRYLQKENKLNDKRINFIAEVGENIGLALTLIELEIKKISVSTNLDKNLREKIESLAKNQGIEVLITQRFKKIQTISELMRGF